MDVPSQLEASEYNFPAINNPNHHNQIMSYDNQNKTSKNPDGDA